MIEELKRYGCHRDVVQTYQENPEKGYPERKIYWQEFEEDDPRYDLTRRLSELFATHWLSSEIKNHIFHLLTWEMERSAQQLSPSPLSTHPISIKQWEYIRDGLADVWDWWGEGVFLRPQPTIIKERRKPTEYTFDAPYVDELTEFCCPLDLEVWKTALPEPVRGTTVDGRLGDAFFDLTAIVHSKLYEYQKQKLDSSFNVHDIEATQRRRYQIVRLANDEQGQDVALIQFAPSGEDGNYFQNYCNRINAAGRRFPDSFPSHVEGKFIYLREANLIGLYLRGAYLSRADLGGAKLNRVDLREADLYRADLYRVDLRLADLRKIDLREADLNGANLGGANLSGANLREADLGGANLSGANLYRVDLYRADLSGANLYRAGLSGANLGGANLIGADLSGVKNIDPEQIKQANNWELAQFDEEMKEKLGL